jgi:hypothetical protein
MRAWRGEEPISPGYALSLRSGDELQIRFDVPPGLESSYFWFDTEGKLHELSPKPLAGSGPHRVLAYPGAGESVALEGPPGTEVIFACARSSKAPGEAELRDLVREGAWPELPGREVVLFDREGVRVQGARGPGAVKAVPGGAYHRAEILQQELAVRFEWFAGLGFQHGK